MGDPNVDLQALLFFILGTSKKGPRYKSTHKHTHPQPLSYPKSCGFSATVWSTVPEKGTDNRQPSLVLGGGGGEGDASIRFRILRIFAGGIVAI